METPAKIAVTNPQKGVIREAKGAIQRSCAVTGQAKERHIRGKLFKEAQAGNKAFAQRDLTEVPSRT